MAGQISPPSEKVALIGLSNAGKTSVIRVLTQEFEMLTCLKPTRMVQSTTIEVFGREFIFWDYGGQEAYMHRYLSMADRYLQQIKYLFYVVDIQDPGLFNRNLEFLSHIVEQLIVFSPDAKIIFLFHKCDPEIEKDPTVIANQKRFLDLVMPLLKQNNFSFTAFPTSIHNHQSVVTAFSQTLFENKLLYRNLSDALKSVMEMYNLGFLQLLNQEMFELGVAISDKMSAAQRNELTVHMFRSGEMNLNKIEEIVCAGNPYRLMISPVNVQIGTKSVKYLLSMAYNDDASLESEGLQVAMDSLAKNLQKMLATINN